MTDHRQCVRLIEEAAAIYKCWPYEVTEPHGKHVGYRVGASRFVDARRYVAIRLRARGYSLRRIARLLGYRSYTSIVHLVHPEKKRHYYEQRKG